MATIDLAQTVDPTTQQGIRQGIGAAATIDLAGKVDKASIGAASGVAALDANGFVPLAQIPSGVTFDTELAQALTPYATNAALATAVSLLTTSKLNFNLTVTPSANTATTGMAWTVKSNIIHNSGVNYPALTIDLPPYSGTTDNVWFIGIDLFRQVLVALPRNIHTGWLVLGIVTVTANGNPTVKNLNSSIPPAKLLRVLRKIKQNEPVNVVVMGSSLTIYPDWSQALFGASATSALYLVPGVNTYNSWGQVGTPNGEQAAFCGSAQRAHFINQPAIGGIAANSFVSDLITNLLPTNGRAAYLRNTDLVVLGCLANYGTDRLDIADAECSILAEMGIDVILTTDTPSVPSGSALNWSLGQGTYTDLQNANLYPDGDYLRELAERYNFELADTAGFMFYEQLRWMANPAPYATKSSYRIFVDTGHPFQQTGTPLGRTAFQIDGYEAMARAVRSVISIDSTSTSVTTQPTIVNYNFVTSTQGFGNYANTTTSYSSNGLTVTKNQAASEIWGAINNTTFNPPVNVGDKIQVTGSVTGTATQAVNVAIMNGSNFGSNIVTVTADGQFTANLTVNSGLSNLTTLGFISKTTTGNLGDSFTVSNIQVSITPANSTTTTTITPIDLIPERITRTPTRSYPFFLRSASATNVKSLCTLGDVVVTLPQDEYHTVLGTSVKGTLGSAATSNGSQLPVSSRFSPGYPTANNYITIAPGQKAAWSAHGAVAFHMINLGVITPSWTADVYINGVKSNSIAGGGITAAGPDFYTEICNCNQLAKTFPTDELFKGLVTCEIVNTSATASINVLLFIAHTAKIEYYGLSDIMFTGAWQNETSFTFGGNSIPCMYTDSASAYAVCKHTGRRLGWIVATNTNSKPVIVKTGMANSRLTPNVTQGIQELGTLYPEIGRTTGRSRIALAANNGTTAAGNRGLAILGAVSYLDR